MIKLNKLRVSFYLISLLLISCNQREFSSIEEYSNAIKTNKNLVNSKSISGVNYSLHYITPEALAIKNIDMTGSDQKDNFNREINKLKEGIYFNLIITDSDSNTKVKDMVLDKQKYAEQLAYANTYFQNSVSVVINNQDTLNCALAHMEPPTNLKPEFRFFLAFNLTSKNIIKEMTFLYNDELFDCGPVKFYYNQEVIDNLPKLNLL